MSEMYALEDFVSDYQKAYGEPPQSKGANAFDIFNLLVWAYESAPSKKLSSAEVKKRLLKVKDRKGAVGTFSIDVDGNSSYPPVWRKISEGKRQLIEIPEIREGE